MTAQGNIYGINGPIIYLKGDSGFQMNEMVYVGTGRLVGEVIGLTSERTTIEVYEETTGLKPGEPVAGTGAPVSATLAPGILTSIFDGIERPLNAIQKESGCYIDRGIHADSLDTKKKWHAHMTVKKATASIPAPSSPRCRRPGPSPIRSWCRRTWRDLSSLWPKMGITPSRSLW